MGRPSRSPGSRSPTAGVCVSRAPCRSGSSTRVTARRYNRFYPYRDPLSPNSPQCDYQASRMRDVSRFMKDLQQRFTCWFNRSRQPSHRRGRLWGDRFKSNIIHGLTGLWTVLKYIEHNPVEAGLTDNAADYRFSSWGEWQGRGRHPFASNFFRHVAHLTYASPIPRGRMGIRTIAKN